MSYGGCWEIFFPVILWLFQRNINLKKKSKLIRSNNRESARWHAWCSSRVLLARKLASTSVSSFAVILQYFVLLKKATTTRCSLSLFPQTVHDIIGSQDNRTVGRVSYWLFSRSNIAIGVKPGFKKVSKGFQTPWNQVSKGSPKGLERVSKCDPIWCVLVRSK